MKMLEYLKKYVKKGKKQTYPKGLIPELTIVIFLGDLMSRKSEEILPVLKSRWPEDMGKSLYICYLNREETEDDGNSHYQFISEKGVPIAASPIEIKGLNDFFRRESYEIMSSGNSMRIIIMTCAEDEDALRAADVAAIAMNFCEDNVGGNVRSYVYSFLPFAITKSFQDKAIRTFFEKSITWKKGQYETEPVFCRFEDSDPETYIASNNGLIEGLLVIDERDENNKDLISDQRQAMLVADSLEFTDLFTNREKYIQIPGIQFSEIGYDFVLASALQKDKWFIEPEASSELMRYSFDMDMKKETEFFREQLRSLLECAVFSSIDPYSENTGRISVTVQKWEELEEQFFGNSLRNLYRQWEGGVRQTPMPKVFRDKIDKVVSFKELDYLKNQLTKIKNNTIESTVEHFNYSSLGPVMSIVDPWQLRDCLITVYESYADYSKNNLYRTWAVEGLDLLEEKQLFLEKQEKEIDSFFERCKKAMETYQSSWNVWNYNGPEMKFIEDKDKLCFRNILLQCVEDGASDYGPLINYVEEYIVDKQADNVFNPEPVFYCRLNSVALHGVGHISREIKSGPSCPNKMAFYSPQITGEIRLIRGMVTANI